MTWARVWDVALTVVTVLFFGSMLLGGFLVEAERWAWRDVERLPISQWARPEWTSIIRRVGAMLIVSLAFIGGIVATAFPTPAWHLVGFLPAVMLLIVAIVRGH